MKDLLCGPSALVNVYGSYYALVAEPLSGSLGTTSDGRSFVHCTYRKAKQTGCRKENGGPSESGWRSVRTVLPAAVSGSYTHPAGNVIEYNVSSGAPFLGMVSIVAPKS